MIFYSRVFSLSGIFFSLSEIAIVSHCQDGGHAESGDQPRSQSGSHILKVQYAHWDSGMDCCGAGKRPWDEKDS